MTIDWKKVQDGDEIEFDTYVAKVPGGYLVKTTDFGYHAITSSIIFVPTETA